MKRVFLLSVFFVPITLFYGCKKTESITLPVLSTEPVTNITFTTAASGGDITSDGNAAITARGVCWSTSSNPTIADTKTSDGNSTGQFVSNIIGITAGTTYYVRAYATNSAGTAYGDEVLFTANSIQLAVLSTSAVSSIASTGATSGGIITDDGGGGITERGVCWSTSSSPTIAGSHTSDGTGKGSFTSNLTGLSASTPYFVRAYATNSAGTAYGNEVAFTTISTQSGNEVTIQGMAFSPQTLTVPVNTTVKWTNNDGISHTVTSDTALFDSGTISSGDTYSFKFTSTGTFNYHCKIHPGMTATIIVQ